MPPYETLKRTELFKGKIMDFVRDTITLPNGKTTDREIVLRGNAAAVVPVDSDGNIILVRQYRHPVVKEVLEIPAGMLEKDEDPMVCAVRELEEETSFKANKVTPVFPICPAIGFCNEMLYIYIAEDLQPGQLNPDPDEFVSVEKYSLDECIDMILNNEIMDGKTVAALLMYKCFFLQ